MMTGPEMEGIIILRIPVVSGLTFNTKKLD